MEINEIKSCIEVYQDFITHCTKENFSELFENSDYCNFDGDSFKSFSNENLYLFLGMKDSKLIGFLVNETIDYTEWTEETQVFESKFVAFDTVSYNEFKEYYLKKTKANSSCAIDSSEAFVRIEDWNANKYNWFSNQIESKTLVKYFEIPTEDYANGHANSFNFGLLDSRIDIVVGTPAGLYDTSRPVPPFDPLF